MQTIAEFTMLVIASVPAVAMFGLARELRRKK